MFILGLLSLTQVLFLPGMVILSLMKITLSFPKRLLFSFGLSLFCNYCFAVFLISIGFYDRASLLTIIFLEVLILICLYRKQLLLFFKLSPSEIAKSVFSFVISIASRIKSSSEDITTEIRQCENAANNKYLVEGVVYCLAVVTVIICFAGSFFSLGDVFETYDAMHNWNHWAMSWAENSIPVRTYNYPQLIPINWSVCYILLGDTIEMFPKFVNSLMFPMLIFTIFLWAKYKKSPEMQIGCMVTAFSFATAFNKYLYDGYVDIAVVCLIIMSLYCLFLASNETSGRQFCLLLFIGMLIAFASAVTKQAGIIQIIVYPIIALNIVRVKKDIKFSVPKAMVTYFLLLVLTVLPFYVHQRKEIHEGSKSEIEYVTNTVHEGRSIPERLGRAASLYLGKILKMDLSADNIKSMLPRSLTGYQGVSYYTKSFVYIFYTFIIILVAIPATLYALVSSVFMRETKLTTFFFLFYWLIWGCFFSYDIRNVSSAIPFWGNAIGFGLWNLLCLRNYSIARVLLKIRWIIFISFIAVVLAIANNYFNSGMLREKELWQKVESIGNKSINLQLIELGEKLDKDNKLLTTYWAAAAFEEVTMKNVYRCIYFRSVTFRGLEVFSKFSDSDDCKYILVTPGVPDYITDYVEEKVKSDYYKILKQTSEYVLYEKTEEVKS